MQHARHRVHLQRGQLLAGGREPLARERRVEGERDVVHCRHAQAQLLEGDEGGSIAQFMNGKWSRTWSGSSMIFIVITFFLQFIHIQYPLSI